MVPKELLEGKVERRPVFYNPRSKLSRDVSCAVLRALENERKLKYLDLLAGTGARGIRVAKEAGCEVHLNDVSARALEVIKKNADLNRVSITTSNVEGNRFLQENLGDFNFIDIDPFGSPAPYISNAVAAVKQDGFIAFAATDTAALYGLYPKTCLRRYSALPLRCEFSKELALRILLGYAARTIAASNKGMHCLISHSSMHYHRTYLHITPRKRLASVPEEMGYVYYCKKCLDRLVERSSFPRSLKCECGGGYEVAGPLWLGPTVDKEFCGAVLRESRYLADADVEKLLSTIAEESEVPLYYDAHVMCKKMRISCPTMGEIFEKLKDSGFEATRTHFSPTAIKTNASAKDFQRALLPVFLLLAVLAELLYSVTAVIAK